MIVPDYPESQRLLGVSRCPNCCVQSMKELSPGHDSTCWPRSTASTLHAILEARRMPRPAGAKYLEDLGLHSAHLDGDCPVLMMAHWEPSGMVAEKLHVRCTFACAHAHARSPLMRSARTLACPHIELHTHVVTHAHTQRPITARTQTQQGHLICAHTHARTHTHTRKHTLTQGTCTLMTCTYTRILLHVGTHTHSPIAVRAH